MGWRSPPGFGRDRTQPRPKSEASASMVSGCRGWKCCRTEAEVKASLRDWKAASASGVQPNFAPFRVREVRGHATVE